TQGLRVLAVAVRHVDDPTQPMTAADEHDLVFVGFVTFIDPPKASAGKALKELQALGLTPKVVTGDSEAVTRHVCDLLGIPVSGVPSCRDLAAVHEPARSAAV